MAIQKVKLQPLLQQLTDKQINFIREKLLLINTRKKDLFNLYTKYTKKKDKSDDFFIKKCYKEELKLHRSLRRKASKNSIPANVKSQYTNEKSKLKKAIEDVVVLDRLKQDDHTFDLYYSDVLYAFEESKYFLKYATTLYESMVADMECDVWIDYDQLAKLCFKIHYFPHASRYYQPPTKTKTHIDFFEEGCRYQYKQMLLLSLRVQVESNTRTVVSRSQQVGVFLPLEKLKNAAEEQPEKIFKLYAELLNLQEKYYSIEEYSCDIADLASFWEKLKSHIEVCSSADQPSFNSWDLQVISNRLAQLISHIYKVCKVDRVNFALTYTKLAIFYTNIYRLLDKHRLLLDRMKISSPLYLTIAMYSSIANDVSYYQSFTTTYAPYLSGEKNRQEIQALVSAHRFLQSQNYLSALKVLKIIPDKSEKFTSILSRILKVQLYYHLRFTKEVENKTDPYFKIIYGYLRDDKVLSQEQNTAIRKLVAFTKRLTKLSNQFSRTQKEKEDLIDDVINEYMLQGRFWLLQEIVQLKTR